MRVFNFFILSLFFLSSIQSTLAGHCHDHFSFETDQECHPVELEHSDNIEETHDEFPMPLERELCFCDCHVNRVITLNGQKNSLAHPGQYLFGKNSIIYLKEVLDTPPKLLYRPPIV